MIEEHKAGVIKADEIAAGVIEDEDGELKAMTNKLVQDIDDAQVHHT